ncbi:UNVERIFIED_CONTAM: Zinc finger BED domain-containing protein RICESLEEPER 2 [Sesamum radiatum]|uniref:Zinc finger BED domain-containing protein RICESLEEPER 2 n=1 Tax=Sesamum radiatum TaxID=300843 RepID=A0AAW2LKT8_SESRA
MRCVAHIINLIVKDGLKELNDSIERVQTVVRYVRQSPARTRKFNDYVLEEKSESEKLLCLDVPMRWNSVYMMLETALIFQGVFEMYEIYDADFRNDFMLGGPYGRIGLPLTDDSVMVPKFVKVLRYFYDLTNQIFGSLYVTSNTFLDEISDVDDLLKGWLKGDDVYLVDMTRQMKAKFDKYWENIEKMNMMLYVAVMLDPRHKYSYLRYVFKNMHGQEIREKMGDLAKYALYDVFEEYKKCILLHHYALLPLHQLNQVRNKMMILNEKQLETRERNGNKWCLRLEVGIGQNWILNEEIEIDESPTFSITEWWKLHTPRFPILARLARDVLAMPISTVASKSAFSTGGGIMDDFRASLTPKMAQALICCQD